MKYGIPGFAFRLQRTTRGIRWPEISRHISKKSSSAIDNQEAIKSQRLAELVTDLYLAEGKKRVQVWKRIVSALEQLKVPADRIKHLQATDDPKLLAKIVQELQAKGM